MEGKDRWNPEFQKPCLQKAKQKQTNIEPPPPPKKPSCTNVPQACFLSAVEGWAPLLPTDGLQSFGILNNKRQEEGGWSPRTVSMVRSWKWLLSVTAHAC